jgi:selenocysteine lyase/cysteine desulfurase
LEPFAARFVANGIIFFTGVLMAIQNEIAELLDAAWVRSQFPALAQTVNGHPAVFLDGPGGTQVPQSVIDAISDYLRNSNANTDGAFATSQRTDAMLDGGQHDLVNLCHEPGDRQGTRCGR